MIEQIILPLLCTEYIFLRSIIVMRAKMGSGRRYPAFRYLIL
jgi:hypothetical protein